MQIRGTSLIFAVVTVAVAMAVGTWLQDYRQFPWILCFAVIYPALTIVSIAAGGPHEASGESWVWVATFVLATLMWYGLIEGGRAALRLPGWRCMRTSCRRCSRTAASTPRDRFRRNTDSPMSMARIQITPCSPRRSSRRKEPISLRC